MKIWYLIFSILSYSTFAKLHNVAVCVSNRKYSEIGGTPFSPSYTWSKEYEILPDETKCACDLYRQRNTGDKQHDQCPDCTFVCFDNCHLQKHMKTEELIPFRMATTVILQGGILVATRWLPLFQWRLRLTNVSQMTYYCEKMCHAQGAEGS